LALTKLSDGSLFLASFAKRLEITDADGKVRKVNGLFAALSLDEGKTWPYKRLVTDDQPAKIIGTMDDHKITLSPHNAEPVGYLSVCEGSNGLVHLISSIHLYSFNKKWIMTPPPPADKPTPPMAVALESAKILPGLYKPKTGSLPSAHKLDWKMSAKKITEENAVSFTDDGMMKLSTSADQQFWFRSETPEVFQKIDSDKGFTVEIKTRILERSFDQSGVTLELYDGLGSRYAMTITDTGIYWYKGEDMGSALLDFDQYFPVAQNFNNTDGFHRYRVAVTPQRNAQIYRDSELIGVRQFEYRTPRDPYVCFGIGKGATALVDYIAWDLIGPKMP
jgi:hypothetical protein